MVSSAFRRQTISMGAGKNEVIFIMLHGFLLHKFKFPVFVGSWHLVIAFQTM